MSRPRLRVCAEPGCPELTTSTRCATHQRPVDAAKNQRAKDHGRRSPYWERLRRAALTRDGYRCRLHVDDGCTEIATTVHIRPELEGNHLAATLDDCLSACAHCHGVTDAPRASERRERR